MWLHQIVKHLFFSFSHCCTKSTPNISHHVTFPISKAYVCARSSLQISDYRTAVETPFHRHRIPCRSTNFLNSRACDRWSLSKVHTHQSFFPKSIPIFLTDEEAFSHVGQREGRYRDSITHSQILPQEQSSFAHICLRNKQPRLTSHSEVAS